MTFVLVHGGGFAGSCWEPLVPLLGARAEAIDLPGRAGRPPDLGAVTIADLVDAVAGDIERMDLRDVVLVGHSMAGITLPGVMARVPDRLRRAVFVATVVPPDGGCVLDVLAPDGAPHAAPREGSAPGALGEDLAVPMFCNDMDEATTRFTLERMVPESVSLISEPVDSSGLAQPVPRTFVRLLRDGALSLDVQQGVIDRLGAVDVVTLDAGHMVMISHPEALAGVLTAL